MSGKEKTNKIDSRCCQSGCPDCPWGFESDPETPAEFLHQKKSNKGELQELVEYYLDDPELQKS